MQAPKKDCNSSLIPALFLYKWIFVPCIQNQEEYLLCVSIETSAQYFSAHSYLVTSSQAMITLKMKSPAVIRNRKEGGRFQGFPFIVLLQFCLTGIIQDIKNSSA